VDSKRRGGVVPQSEKRKTSGKVKLDNSGRKITVMRISRKCVSRLLKCDCHCSEEK